MTVLAIRTDKPEAELCLYSVKGPSFHTAKSEIKWLAHRRLAETIHGQIAKLLNKSSISLEDISGVICFKGPGSFTGLRIGLSVANTLAYALNLPIVATKGEKWFELGIKQLIAGRNEYIVTPFYGRPANTTKPRK